MAAPMLSNLQQKLTVRSKIKKKKPSGKTILWNPFDISWPKIEAEVEDAILGKLRSVIKPLGIEKEKCISKKKTEKTEATDTKAKPAAVSEEITNRKKIRKQLLVGVNEVTRSLEKDDTRLVLVCCTAKPAHITNHLIGLAATRKCPALCIGGLSDTAGSLLNLKSVVALAFKKISAEDSTVFNELVEFITEKAIKITVPWMEGDTNRDATIATEENDTKKVTIAMHHIKNEDSSVNTKNLGKGDCDGVLEKPSLDDLLPLEKNDIVSAGNDSLMETSDLDTSQDTKLPKDVNSRKRDYSCFYVYKAEAETKTFTGDFIAFSKEDSGDVIDGQVAVVNVPYKKVKTHFISGNPNKQKKKTNKNKMVNK